MKPTQAQIEDFHLRHALEALKLALASLQQIQLMRTLERLERDRVSQEKR